MGFQATALAFQAIATAFWGHCPGFFDYMDGGRVGSLELTPATATGKPSMPMYRNLNDSANRIIDAVHDLPREAAPAIARLFREMASELDAIGERANRQQRHKAAAQDFIKLKKRLPFEIRDHMIQGDGYPMVRDALVKKYALPPATIDQVWDQHKKRTAASARQFRNQKIIERYMGGWKDREIASEYRISERQVQRVLSGHRKPHTSIKERPHRT